MNTIVTTTPCELCGAATRMLNTRRCDQCWELEKRVTANPDLTAKILARVLGVSILVAKKWPTTCPHGHHAPIRCVECVPVGERDEYISWLRQQREFESVEAENAALRERPNRRTNFTDVAAFHDRFGLDRDRPPTPSHLAPELLRFRVGFLLEELAEYAKAAGLHDVGCEIQTLAVVARTATVEPRTAPDLVHAFDGLLDLVVVALGTADFHGVPWEAGWDVVMARNNAKRRAKPDGSDSKRGSPFDVVKPPGWYSPELELRALLGVDTRDDVNADFAAWKKARQYRAEYSMEDIAAILATRGDAADDPSRALVEDRAAVAHFIARWNLARAS